MAQAARRVIGAQVVEATAFAVRLAEHAASLARARAEAALRARAGDPSRWRRAALLWPLNAKDR